MFGKGSGGDAPHIHKIMRTGKRYKILTIRKESAKAGIIKKENSLSPTPTLKGRGGGAREGRGGTIRSAFIRAGSKDARKKDTFTRTVRWKFNRDG